MRFLAALALVIAASAVWGQEYVELFSLTTTATIIGVYHPDRQVITVTNRPQFFGAKDVPSPDEPVFEYPVLPDMILDRVLWRDPAHPDVEPIGAAEYKKGPTNPGGGRSGTREEQIARNQAHSAFWKERCGYDLSADRYNSNQMDRDAGQRISTRWRRELESFRAANRASAAASR